MHICIADYAGEHAFLSEKECSYASLCMQTTHGYRSATMHAELVIMASPPLRHMDLTDLADLILIFMLNVGILGTLS